MNKILSDKRALRLCVYAATTIIGVAAIAGGFTTSAEVETWLEKAPAIAGTLASLLAMANITPRNAGNKVLPDPTADYAARLRGEQG